MTLLNNQVVGHTGLDAIDLAKVLNLLEGIVLIAQL